MNDHIRQDFKKKFNFTSLQPEQRLMDRVDQRFEEMFDAVNQQTERTIALSISHGSNKYHVPRSMTSKTAFLRQCIALF